jgi:membrane fusion protein, multidrug efflux system
MSNRSIKNFLLSKLKLRKVIIIVVMILLVGLIYKYFVQPSEQNKKQHSKVVEVEEVQLKNIKQTVELIGTIKSRQQSLLTAKVKGILNIITKPGQAIKKGELIAEIENNDIKNNFKILKEAERIAKAQFERYNSLFKSGVASKTVVEKNKALLLEVRKKASDAKMALDEIKIYAPFDGVVGLFKFREGSQVQSGDSIVSFYDPAALIVEFDIPLSVAKQVQNGSQVFVKGKEYSLTHIQKMLDEATHMCPAYVTINCQDCIIGTPVDVSLVVQERQSIIVIPFESIFLREGKPFVYIAKENKANLTPVQLGIRNKQLVEITSGVKEGDQVIVFGHNRLYPDIPITIFKGSTIKTG